MLNTFNTMVSQIYPTELQLNKEYSFDNEVSVLDLDLSIANGIVSSQIYDNLNFVTDKEQTRQHNKDKNETHITKRIHKRSPALERSSIQKDYQTLLKVGYNNDIMRQSACLIVKPIAVYSYGFLFNCMTSRQTSDSIMPLT